MTLKLPSLRAQRSNPYTISLCAFAWIVAAAFGLVAMTAFPSSSHAQNTPGFFSGAYLQEVCKSNADGSETVRGGHTACQAYIAGVIDYHKLMKSLGTAPTIDFCVPNTVPMKRLQSIVWVYLKKHSGNNDFIAAPAVTLALYSYYPCKKKK